MNIFLAVKHYMEKKVKINKRVYKSLLLEHQNLFIHTEKQTYDFPSIMHNSVLCTDQVVEH